MIWFRWSCCVYLFIVDLGGSCDRCADNYYGHPLVPGGTCERCMCNHNIDYNVPDSCDQETGECLKCLYNTEGPRCERCRPGYFGDAAQQSCRGVYSRCGKLSVFIIWSVHRLISERKYRSIVFRSVKISRNILTLILYYVGFAEWNMNR